MRVLTPHIIHYTFPNRNKLPCKQLNSWKIRNCESVWICFIVCIHSFEDEEDEETWPLVFLLLDFANNPINCIAWRIGTRVNLRQTKFFSYIQYSCNLTTRLSLEGCWSQLVQNSFPVHANTRFPMKSKNPNSLRRFPIYKF
jgi:hypothetical protein